MKRGGVLIILASSNGKGFVCQVIIEILHEQAVFERADNYLFFKILDGILFQRPLPLYVV